MLAAFLRGLLKPSTEFGSQSYLFEGVILEAMTADIAADNFKLSVTADAALASILTAESKRDTLRKIARQSRRLVALRLMDIYGLAAGSRAVVGGGRFSLLQLFQVMKNKGIITPDEAAGPLQK